MSLQLFAYNVYFEFYLWYFFDVARCDLGHSFSVVFSSRRVMFSVTSNNEFGQHFVFKRIDLNEKYSNIKLFRIIRKKRTLAPEKVLGGHLSLYPEHSAQCCIVMNCTNIIQPKMQRTQSSIAAAVFGKAALTDD